MTPPTSSRGAGPSALALSAPAHVTMQRVFVVFCSIAHCQYNVQRVVGMVFGCVEDDLGAHRYTIYWTKALHASWSTVWVYLSSSFTFLHLLPSLPSIGIGIVKPIYTGEASFHLLSLLPVPSPFPNPFPHLLKNLLERIAFQCLLAHPCCQLVEQRKELSALYYGNTFLHRKWRRSLC